MKKSLAILILCLPWLTAICLAGPNSDTLPVVYGLRFGTPRDSVVKSFEERKIKQLRNEDTLMVFRMALVDVPDLDEFYVRFDDSSRVMLVKLVFKTAGADTSLKYILDRYHELQAQVKETYGKPRLEGEYMAKQYDNNTYRLYGLTRGYGLYSTHWETKANIDGKKKKELSILLSVAPDGLDWFVFDLIYAYLPLFDQYKAKKK